MDSDNQPTYSVAAYITAFEDAIALNYCLMALRAQSHPIKQIIIVDNSLQPLEVSQENRADDRLLTWHHPENIGMRKGWR